LNNLLREIVADFFERVDDDRFGFLTITGLEVDADLNKAEVFVSILGQDPDPEGDAEVLEALSEYRTAVQSTIASQARIRKTPEVVFTFDPGVRAGARIEEILSGIDDQPVPDPEESVYGRTSGPEPADDSADEATSTPSDTDPDAAPDGGRS
jgi:ribosome-binding factor A